MLQNRIYRGEIAHKRATYPGRHAAIVDEPLWDAVQGRLADNRVDRASAAQAAAPSLLAGLVTDARGERMTPTHANKKGVRYRYSVSHDLIQRGRGRGRIPRPATGSLAVDLERLVERKILAFLTDDAALHDALETILPDAAMRRAAMARAGRLARRWPALPALEQRLVVQRLIEKIAIGRASVTVAMKSAALVGLGSSDEDPLRIAPVADDGPIIDLTVAMTLKRVGKEMRLVIEGLGARRPTFNRSLLRLLGQAHRFHQMVLNCDGAATETLAAERGQPSHLHPCPQAQLPVAKNRCRHPRGPPTADAQRRIAHLRCRPPSPRLVRPRAPARHRLTPSADSPDPIPWSSSRSS